MRPLGMFKFLLKKKATLALVPQPAVARFSYFVVRRKEERERPAAGVQLASALVTFRLNSDDDGEEKEEKIK